MSSSYGKIFLLGTGRFPKSLYLWCFDAESQYIQITEIGPFEICNHLLHRIANFREIEGSAGLSQRSVKNLCPTGEREAQLEALKDCFMKESSLYIHGKWLGDIWISVWKLVLFKDIYWITIWTCSLFENSFKYWENFETSSDSWQMQFLGNFMFLIITSPPNY